MHPIAVDEFLMTHADTQDETVLEQAGQGSSRVDGGCRLTFPHVGDAQPNLDPFGMAQQVSRHRKRVASDHGFSDPQRAIAEFLHLAGLSHRFGSAR